MRVTRWILNIFLKIISTNNMEKRKKHKEIIVEIFLELNQEFLKGGTELKTLRYLVKQKNATDSKEKFHKGLNLKFLMAILVIPLIIGMTLQDNFLTKHIYGIRCYIPNNYLVWEFTRPVSDCGYCRGVESASILRNITKEEFAKYAYSSRPIIIKNAIKDWKASRIFSIKFFRKLYESIDGAYTSIDEECQFLHFKSNFASLREVLEMSEERANNSDGEKSWYVGWKNCHPQVLEIMRKYYNPPDFLPDDAEIPQTNYVFVGYDQGAIMHLDYIPRLMWQSQILGNKIWTVAPTPECDNLCNRFNFSVDSGDVVLLDTRIWYHGTYVKKGKLSLTITSEYG